MGNIWEIYGKYMGNMVIYGNYVETMIEMMIYPLEIVDLSIRHDDFPW